ncbi:MAG: hypothetical protein NVS3B14_07700 [Ktedonobacteraceae bacterium]
MAIITHPAFVYDDDFSWSTLILWLAPQVRGWVYTSNLPCWKGEEEAIVEEIVNETVTRILEHIKKVSSHNAKPIASMYGFARQTARHYFIDLLRKDRKSLRLSQLTNNNEEPAIRLFLTDIEEAVLNAVCYEQLFKLLAQEIITFPKKQKEAILRHHARLMDSMVDPAPLLRAYQSVGIHLKDYLNYAPINNVERRQHSSLLHWAYLRLSRSPLIRAYIYGVSRQSA